MSKTVFILLNAVYFVFDYVCIPMINPEGVLFGWLPFQMFLYVAMGIPAALLWGFYFTQQLKNQDRYDDDGNIVKGGKK